mmetsp:Transcript_129335/g.374538  ORF Transcript_129335/g.374538 Transcript_129335/m.374538 type:complete len:201 (+) Transcript_129335:322-924(+)
MDAPLCRQLAADGDLRIACAAPRAPRVELGQVVPRSRQLLATRIADRAVHTTATEASCVRSVHDNIARKVDDAPSAQHQQRRRAVVSMRASACGSLGRLALGRRRRRRGRVVGSGRWAQAHGTNRIHAEVLPRQCGVTAALAASAEDVGHRSLWVRRRFRRYQAADQGQQGAHAPHSSDSPSNCAPPKGATTGGLTARKK